MDEMQQSNQVQEDSADKDIIPIEEAFSNDKLDSKSNNKFDDKFDDKLNDKLNDKPEDTPVEKDKSEGSMIPLKTLNKEEISKDSDQLVTDMIENTVNKNKSRKLKKIKSWLNAVPYLKFFKRLSHKVSTRRSTNEIKNSTKEISIMETQHPITTKVKSKFNNKLFHNRLTRKLRKSWDNINSVPTRNVIIPTAFFVLIILYLEFVVHLLLYKSIDNKIIYPILFSLPAGAFFSFVSGWFNRIINKVIIWILTIGLCLAFCVQLIYFDVFKVFFSVQSLGMAGDAISEFGSDVVTAIKNNILGMFLLLIPIAALAVLVNQFYDWDRRDIKKQGILLAGSMSLHIFAILTLMIFGKGDYTPYDLYYNTQIHDLCGKQLGILTMTRIDIGNLLEGESELVLAETDIIDWDIDNYPTAYPTLEPTSIPQITPSPTKPDALPTLTPQPTEIPIDTSPNIMDIDFRALAEQEEDDTIKTLHKYFANAEPTNKNKYTGMFQGYNLILITAEGFSPYAVHKEKTPTLYKLVNEGFIFKNFYTALWQTSTSDGEYVPLTGLIPIGTRSMYKTRNNLLPLTLGHQFQRLGIDTKAYHNHTYTYYQRDETHPNLGYDYEGVGNGLVLEHNVWPNSDLEMINATVDEYIGQEPFHVYYLTVSGHMNYTFIGNSMSYKNKALVEDLPYSSDGRAYIACQMELDMALNELIRRLEEAGVAERTVIALSADHYPYGWEKEKLDELAGHEVDPYFEIYRNHFILWNAGMKESIVVDEPCSSLDILPTLSNLFGLEYDSRLLMGRDIFSDAPPLAILSNRSFITDKVMYNSETRETILLADEALPEDYIKNMIKVIKNKFSISDSIVSKDYYRYVFPQYD